MFPENTLFSDFKNKKQKTDLFVKYVFLVFCSRERKTILKNFFCKELPNRT